MAHPRTRHPTLPSTPCPSALALVLRTRHKARCPGRHVALTHTLHSPCSDQKISLAGYYSRKLDTKTTVTPTHPKPSDHNTGTSKKEDVCAGACLLVPRMTDAELAAATEILPVSPPKVIECHVCMHAIVFFVESFVHILVRDCPLVCRAFPTPVR